jgi:hypothetical protein
METRRAAVDEISVFTTLRPSAPADAVAAREAARERLVGVLSAPDATSAARVRSRAWPRHRMLGAGAVITAAAAAAIVVPAVLPGSATGTFVTKAWAVERNQDGTVTVSFDEVATGSAALQRALRADGVHAFVRVLPMKTAYVKGAGREFYAACNYSGLDKEPLSVQQAVIQQNFGQSRDQSWTIRPSAMPGKSSLLITLWPSSAVSVLLNPVVLSTYQPPACVPAKPPA